MTDNVITEQDREDLALGRHVRGLKGDLVGTAHFACMLLIGQAVRLGAARNEYTEGGVTIEGQLAGDWKVAVEEITAESLAPDDLSPDENEEIRA